MVHLLRFMSEHRHLLKSARTISTFTILSRIFGYIRDWRVAFLLGTGNAADAFTIAYRIPNLLRRVVGEGAVNAAFIPVFSGYLSRGKRDEAWEFTNALLAATTVLIASVTILGIVFSPLIVRLLASGFVGTPGKLELTSLLNRIMFPYIIFLSLSALATGVLNSLHRFAAPAFAPVLLNMSTVGFSFLSSYFPSPVIALAVGVVVGGILQVAIQIPVLMLSGWRFRLIWNLAHSGVQRLGSLMLPLLFGMGIVQINVFIDLQFASRMGEGGVASVNLADRVMELVLGGYTVALATAILPLLSRQAATGRIDEMKRTLNLATRLILFITIPATIGLMLLRRQIIEVLFQHGNFDARSTELTSRPLLFFAIGLTTISMVKIIVPAFYALQDTRTPVIVAFMSMFLNFGLNVLFMGPLRNGGPPLATSLAVVFDSTVLMTIFYRRYGSYDLRDISRSVFRFALASTIMATATYFVIHIPGFYSGHLLHRILALATAISVATGTYFAASYLLRIRELRELWGIYGAHESETADEVAIG